MANKATTVDEQIEILRSRGMIIEPEELDKAKEYLLDIGYYRLGFYWHYYEIDAFHNLKPDTKLKDVIELYYLDVDLRNILSKYIYRIEVHFRTQLVYHTSNQYSQSSTWFMDSRVVGQDFLNVLDVIYNEKFIKNNIAIKKHHQKYINDKYAPAWKTLEFFMFGQIFNLYRNLKDIQLKEKIAGVYGIRDISVFENHIRAIINIRNIASHNAVLFDYNQPYGIRKIPSKKYRLKTRNQTNLNASLRLVLFVLSKVSQNRANDLENQLRELLDKAMLNKAIKENIESHICFDL